MKDPDVKINSVCCMVKEIENEIKLLLNPICPNETALIVRLYRGVLEDVIELICRSPKCVDIFRGYKHHRADDFNGIVSILLKIVFSLDLHDSR